MKKKIRAVLCLTLLLYFVVNNKQEVYGKVIEKETITVKQEELYSEPRVIQMSELECYYNPTEEERQWAYKIAFAEAGLEDSLGQKLVINSAINNMKERGFTNLIEEFTAEGRYSSVKDGTVCIVSRLGTRPVKESDLTEELKDAVDDAFRKDYTEELLKKAMEEKMQEDANFIADEEFYEGGALYFYNESCLSNKQLQIRNEERVPVSFVYGNHTFYRYWR